MIILSVLLLLSVMDLILWKLFGKIMIGILAGLFMANIVTIITLLIVCLLA